MASAWPFLVLGAIGLVALGSGASEKEAPDPMSDSRGDGPIPKLLMVGWPGDSQIDSLLAELDADLKNAGATHFTAREMTKWDKGTVKNGQRPSGFATKDRWDDAVETVVSIVEPIRTAYGKSLEMDGYRDPQYNAKVGGAARSRHMWMDAFDLHPVGATQADKERLVQIAVAFFNNQRQGAARNMGLGVYPTTGSVGHASHIHVDSGGRRTWGLAKKYGAVA